jgi:hypothetical protein
MGTLFCTEREVGLEIILGAPMEILGDVGHVEACFRLFGDCVNLDARNVHGLCRTHHRLRNHFRMVCSGQTEHLSCAEINTVSKWTDMSVNLTHVT